MQGLDIYQDEKTRRRSLKPHWPTVRSRDLISRPSLIHDMVPPVGIALPPGLGRQIPRSPLRRRPRSARRDNIRLFWSSDLKNGFNGRLVNYDDVLAREDRDAGYGQRGDRVRLVSRYRRQPGAFALSHSAFAAPLAEGVQIIVGLWPSEEAAQRDDAARTAIGATRLDGLARRNGHPLRADRDQGG